METSTTELFGELYLRSTRPFLSQASSLAEARYLAAHVSNCPGGILDLGCGHGRHLQHLRTMHGFATRLLVGLDFDALSLREARLAAPVVRASFGQMPFRDDALGSAFCWYNTLGTFEDEQVPALLAELARCIRPKGLFIVQATDMRTAAAKPVAEFNGRLPDGSHLLETVRYNEKRRRDELRRELTLSDGRFMAASFFIRYYGADEWETLLDAAGFRMMWVHGAVDGSAPSVASVELIVGAQKRG